MSNQCAIINNDVNAVNNNSETIKTGSVPNGSLVEEDIIYLKGNRCMPQLS